MDFLPLGSDLTCNISTESHYGFSKAMKSTYSLKGQEILTIGHGHPSQQGVYNMDFSFDHGTGTDADRQNRPMDREEMTQLNKCMVNDSSNVAQQCQSRGCNEAIEGQTVLCKSHIIGQRCQMLGCPHVVPHGSVLCTSHGGAPPRGEPGCSAAAYSKSDVSIKHEGDRFRVIGNAGNTLSSTGTNSMDDEVVMCKHQGCSKRSQGNTMYCKVHSGVSKRCMVQGCAKGAHGGTPLCIGHGGGKRCIVTGCANAACGSNQGRTDCCVRHGGGKRCNFDGCGKGAQGNTDFCIAHGGGRRCKYEGCGKSAQGRTDYCIKHGGGKRCKFQGCCRSAKWGKDFCSVHKKSLSHASSSDKMLPAPPPKRHAKKPKKARSTVETAGPSVDAVSRPAIPGRCMANVVIPRVAAVGLSDSPMMEHAAVVRQQLPQSPAKLSPPGLASSTEAGAETSPWC